MTRLSQDPVRTSRAVAVAQVFAILAPLAGLLLFGRLYHSVSAGEDLGALSFPVMGIFEMEFVVDRLSVGFGILVSSLYLLAIVYSLKAISKGRLHYYAILILNYLSLAGITLASDLLGFYVFFEMASITAYFLIIHSRKSEAHAAGYKYIIMMLSGGVFVLGAMVLLCMVPGTGGARSGWAAVLFTTGCLLKAGAVPFHVWLPDAHPAAPSPISALLSGVMIKVGAYGLARAFFYPAFMKLPAGESSTFALESLRGLSEAAAGVPTPIVNPSSLLVVAGAVSMVVGVSLALFQKDLKRLLAYHSVSQIGYVLLGFGVGGYGFAGGLLHLCSHAVFKGLLFLAVGAVIFRTGKKKISMLGGLWRKMPVTTIACVIAALSISGVPITSGYASKGILFAGLKGSIFLQIVFVLTSAGTCASFLKLVRHTFWGEPNSSLEDVKEVPATMYVPMICLAIASLGLGIFSGPALEVFLGESAPNLQLWTVAGILKALLSLGLGAGLYWALLKSGAFGIHHAPQEGADEHEHHGPSWRDRLPVPSMDTCYKYIARAVYAVSAKMEEFHPRSLNAAMQLAIGFLVFILIVQFARLPSMADAGISMLESFGQFIVNALHLG